MTAHHVYDLHCDADGCDRVFSCGERYAVDARKQSALEGWIHAIMRTASRSGVSPSLDFCHEHVHAPDLKWNGNGVDLDDLLGAVADSAIGRLLDESAAQIESLGPASDTPDVLIEIRAAELSDLAGSHATPIEALGWAKWTESCLSTKWTESCLPTNTPEWQAGWLGRHIYEENHEDST